MNPWSVVIAVVALAAPVVAVVLRRGMVRGLGPGSVDQGRSHLRDPGEEAVDE